MKHQHPSFVRFLDLSEVDLNCDLHIHTTRTDGKADIKSVIDAANELGLHQIAFTEHVRKSSDWFGDFASEVRDKATAYAQLQVFVGCEAKALDKHGLLDVSEEILAECDLVLGSVHRFPQGNGGFVDFASLSREECARIEFDLAMGLISSAPIDALAHPGGMYARRYGTDLPEEMISDLMTKSIERGVAIEINSSYLKDIPRFLELCAKLNPYVSIGSDMHHLEHLGQCRDVLMAERRFIQ